MAGMISLAIVIGIFLVWQIFVETKREHDEFEKYWADIEAMECEVINKKKEIKK